MLLGIETTPVLDASTFETLFPIVFAVVCLLVLGGFVFVGYTIWRSSRAARRAGVDPFTSPAQVLAQAMQGSGRPLEQRLQELDDLHRRGVITAEEHRSARARALASG